jgi:UV DNA damage endonuclease
LKLPGWDTFNNVIPYERADDNKPVPKSAKKKKTKKQIANEIEGFGKELSDEEEIPKTLVPEEEIGMGGPENRVYWPQGMEEWLRPKKREIKKKGGAVDEDEMFKNPTPANFAARKAVEVRNKAPLSEEYKERLVEAGSVADVKKILEEIKAANAPDEEEEKPKGKGKGIPAKKATPGKKTTPAPRKKTKGVMTPSVSNEGEDEVEEDEDESMLELSDGEGDELTAVKATHGKGRAAPARQSGRAKAKKMSYKEEEVKSEEEL